LRIAVLEVDEAQAGLVTVACRGAGHDCEHFRSGRALLQASPASSFDAIVMGSDDTSLSPHEVVMWLRRSIGHTLPLALVGGLDNDTAVAACYDAGADIYLRRPFAPAELVARLAATARRVAPPSYDPCDLEHGAFRFATGERRVWVNGHGVMLAPKEYDLSVLLFRHIGNLVLRETMIDQIWRREVDPNSRTVDSHLSRIRTKLALWPHNGVRLSAIYGLGSRLDPA